MKKFTLVTEYGENELRQLLTEVVNDVVQQALSKHISPDGNSPPNQTSDKLLSRNQASKFLGISIYALIKLQMEMKVKAVIVGGNYKYSQKQLSSFMSSANNK